MIVAETVQHLHNAMTWDFRSMMILNAIFYTVLILFIVSRKR